MSRLKLFCLSLGVAVGIGTCFPVMPIGNAQITVTPREHQRGTATGDADRVEWQDDGDYLEVYNVNDDAVLFRIELSTGNMILGADGNPAATSLLALSSTTKGFTPPRMTTTQRDAMSPGLGDTIFNITTCDLEIFDGGQFRGAFRGDGLDGGT